MWKHVIPVELARDRRVAVEHEGGVLFVSAQLRRTASGPVVDLFLDDPDNEFVFTPERQTSQGWPLFPERIRPRPLTFRKKEEESTDA